MLISYTSLGPQRHNGISHFSPLSLNPSLSLTGKTCSCIPLKAVDLNLDQLYVLVLSAFPTTGHNKTNTKVLFVT